MQGTSQRVRKGPFLNWPSNTFTLTLCSCSWPIFSSNYKTYYLFIVQVIRKQFHWNQNAFAKLCRSDEILFCIALIYRRLYSTHCCSRCAPHNKNTSTWPLEGSALLPSIRPVLHSDRGYRYIPVALGALITWLLWGKAHLKSVICSVICRGRDLDSSLFHPRNSLSCPTEEETWHLSVDMS